MKKRTIFRISLISTLAIIALGLLIPLLDIPYQVLGKSSETNLDTFELRHRVYVLGIVVKEEVNKTILSSCNENEEQAPTNLQWLNDCTTSYLSGVFISWKFHGFQHLLTRTQMLCDLDPDNKCLHINKIKQLLKEKGIYEASVYIGQAFQKLPKKSPASPSKL